MSADRPNILFLMTDQQRSDARSAHGGWIRTPNLDQLARTGVDLCRHFAQAPVCVPSRCSLFTGRYPHAHRVLENDALLAPHEVHLFKALKSAGYHLGYFGKNHVLPEAEMMANADHYDDAQARAPEPVQRAAYQKLEDAAIARLGSIGSYASAAFHDFPDDVTTTGIIAARAVAHLQSAPTDRPWCTVASFYDPHVPHLAPRRFAERYPPTSIPLPASDPAELDSKAPRARIKQLAQNAHRATAAEKRHYLAVYASMCSFIDEQIGRILEALRHRPDAARTIVVFVSDHGDFGWHHGLCKKDLLLYDDLLHVPAIVSWPAAFAPQIIDRTLTEHVDLVPTLLEFARIPVPFGCQGKSLAPLLRGETSHHRSEIHAEVCYPWMRSGFASHDEFRAAWLSANAAGQPLGHTAPYNVPGDYTKCLRTTDWKYIWYGEGFEELYDVRHDPAETANLATDPQFSGQRDHFRELLFRWLVESADPRSPRTEREQLASYAAWNSFPMRPGPA